MEKVMDEFSQNVEDEIPSYLSNLEESVLEELSVREKNYSVRFNGLRRLLRDVHQQKLSRALERLQEDRLIKQYPGGGYGLGDDSYDRIREYFGNQELFGQFQKGKKEPNSIQTEIIANKEIPVSELVRLLAGKYFGYYRFVGHSFNNNKGRLEWIHVEDHSKILISTISPKMVKIESFNVSNTTVERFIQLIRQMMVSQNILFQERYFSPSNPN
jgi:hypothetical protein